MTDYIIHPAIQARTYFYKSIVSYTAVMIHETPASVQQVWLAEEMCLTSLNLFDGKPIRRDVVMDKSGATIVAVYFWREPIFREVMN